MSAFRDNEILFTGVEIGSRGNHIGVRTIRIALEDSKQTMIVATLRKKLLQELRVLDYRKWHQRPLEACIHPPSLQWQRGLGME